MNVVFSHKDRRETGGGRLKCIKKVAKTKMIEKNKLNVYFIYTIISTRQASGNNI